MNNNTLVRITKPSDDCVAFSTYDRKHGRHGRFIVLEDTIIKALRGSETIHDRDIGNFISVRNANGMVILWFTWLNETYDGCGTVKGFNQMVKVPTATIEKVLCTGEPEKVLCRGEFRNTTIIHTTASKTIRKVLSDKLKRRALSKAMRDSFAWDGDTVTLYPDGGENFYFVTESGWPRNGGLILHKSTEETKAGLKPKFYFGVHT